MEFGAFCTVEELEEEDVIVSYGSWHAEGIAAYPIHVRSEISV